MPPKRAQRLSPREQQRFSHAPRPAHAGGGSRSPPSPSSGRPVTRCGVCVPPPVSCVPALALLRNSLSRIVLPTAAGAFRGLAAFSEPQPRVNAEPAQGEGKAGRSRRPDGAPAHLKDGQQLVKMAARPQEPWRPWRGETSAPEREEPGGCVGRQLGEPGKFAYAALCAVSLASLFPEQEESSFRTGFVESLVQWLELPEAVLPAMMAFARGLGGEGTETFVQILLKDPALKDDAGIITRDLVAFSLKDGSYDARARVLLSHVTWLLRIPLATLEASEERLLECLKEEKEEESETAEASRKRKEKKKRLKRYLLIGLATVGGGTVIGLTGGLAAPLVAAGAATVIGSAGAAALGSTAGIAVMASLFGAAGAGLTGYKMKKRVGAIEEFEFLSLTEGKQLHVMVAITGWLSTGKYGSFSAPWSNLLQSREQYCLAWESKYLLELGSALDSLLNGLVNMVAQEALKYTVLAGVVAALTWPASLLTVASVIDNPWGVCLHRSAEVGKHLAQILLRRQQGKRPVSLIGFSLGARVVYFCLQEMAREEEMPPRTVAKRAPVCASLQETLFFQDHLTLGGAGRGAPLFSDCRGIIEDVVLLGAPVEGDAKCWKPLTKVVSGKIINGYCRSVALGGRLAGGGGATKNDQNPDQGFLCNPRFRHICQCRGDWLLSFVYRTSSAQLNVAGLQPVGLDDRRMVNVDLSSVVSGHLDYMKQMDTILKAVGVKTRECRLEEQGALAALSVEAKESPGVKPHSHTQEEQSMLGGEENGDDHWAWEPVSSPGSCPQAESEQRSVSGAERSQTPPGQEDSVATSSSHSPESSGTTGHHVCSASAPVLR
ncbi:hypothetical protein lerEdw1_003186 [Lerista edwardsae]|nr:hypothetical protein lerEdw1_003186 [Lerista edwardsae]